jgi:tetratricopeptide (TPR) repeat protein
LISLAGREDDWTTFDTLNTLRFGPKGVPFAHTIVLELRRGGTVLAPAARELAARNDPELFHAADDVALFLNDLPSAEKLLLLGTAPDRAVTFRDSSYRRLALLHLGQGRWRDAAGDLTHVSQPGGRLKQAFYASLPFSGADRADIEAVRREIERWDPVSDPAPAGSDLEAALEPHLRLWLLGLLAARLGAGPDVVAHADELERLPVPGGAIAVVRSMRHTLRAAAAARENRVTQALELLEPVKGEVPAPLLRVSYYGEEPARYLRAELLQRAGRDAEALDWLRYGFADTPTELAYLAPIHLKQGEIHEQRGDRAQATRHYQRFLQLWDHCDPALQPAVREVRSRLARLTAEPRSRDEAPADSETGVNPSGRGNRAPTLP